MLNRFWRRCWRRLYWPLTGGLTPRRPASRGVRLEELEARLAPASFAVNSQLQVSNLDVERCGVSTPVAPATAVIFFESAVADYQILRQGLGVGTDAVLLDSGGDGLKEMAAFLADRHDLRAIGVVAHGSPGVMALGTMALSLENVGHYAPELAAAGSALAPGGELDLWSCDVGEGQAGFALVGALAAATGARVA